MALARKVSKINVIQSKDGYRAEDTENGLRIDDRGFIEDRLDSSIKYINKDDIQLGIEWISSNPYIKFPCFNIKEKYYSTDLLTKIMYEQTQFEISRGAMILAFHFIGYAIKRIANNGGIRLHRPLGDYMEDQFRFIHAQKSKIGL